MEPASLSEEALLKKKRKVTAVGEGRAMEDMDLEAVEAEEGEESPGARRDPGENEGLEGGRPTMSLLEVLCL
jgi:hypothetical protein